MAEDRSLSTDHGDHSHRHRRSKQNDDHDHSRHHRHHKRRKLSPGSEDHRNERQRRKHRHREHRTERHKNDVDLENNGTNEPEAEGSKSYRDSWMQAPSSLDIDYTQKGARRAERATLQVAQSNGELINETPLPLTRPEIDYTFGDSGSNWRMTRLKAVFRQAKESGMAVEEVALERYGDLQAFDEAREEEIELGRRETYGKDYSIKEKPDGELFRSRKPDDPSKLEPPVMDAQHPQSDMSSERSQRAAQKSTLDQTALNKLKAQMMKAKLKGSKETARLEAEYNKALTASANRGPEIVVLDPMQNRMLAGGRSGEVVQIDNKRGRERGLVKGKEDMSIDDMVREERRTRGQAGGDGRRFADRIAKDAKFDNDLEYMDENAEKLAKRVQRSEVNLRSTAISDFQKTNRILDKCPLCHHEDTQTPPIAPLVSLATRVYLTLPTDPEIGDGGACIVPIQHRSNLLECDDDEWDEIRNFMKCLIRMYHDQGRDVVFYENAAHPQKMRHAAIEVVPLPYSLGETAPAFFKEAILTSDEEWTQHSKIINTQSKAKNGLGRLAFRKTLAKEMPYFHVWFDLDGGLGHVVEDTNRWPRGDLFAREVIGGMLDAGPEIIKRQGRWRRDDPRVDGFRKRWKKFDWTKVLTDG